MILRRADRIDTGDTIVMMSEDSTERQFVVTAAKKTQGGSVRLFWREEENDAGKDSSSLFRSDDMIQVEP